MLRVLIGGTGGRRYVRPCSCKQFSFQMCLEHGDGSGTFGNWQTEIIAETYDAVPSDFTAIQTVMVNVAIVAIGDALCADC